MPGVLKAAYTDIKICRMCSMLSVEDAGVAFEQFPFLKTMPAYKDFAASGSTDPVQVGAKSRISLSCNATE